MPGMSPGWTLLHGGALGDLVLTVHLALRLQGVGSGKSLGVHGRYGARPLHRCDRPPAAHVGRDGTSSLHVISRVALGDLSQCRPTISRQSSDGIGLHWLFADADVPPPPRLLQSLRGRRVLSALGGPETEVHQGIQALQPAELYGFDPRPQPGSQRHITTQWQTQLEAQGLLIPKCIHQRPAQRCLGVPGALRKRGQRRLRAAAGNAEFVVIHPGSGGRAKCWPLAGFVDVGRRLRDADLAVCFLIGPVELETWPRSTWSALERDFALLSCPSPDDLVAVLAGARAFIGNDAGPSHLAALLGTPTVTVFGPTSANVWRPRGARAAALQGDPARYPENWGVDPSQVAEAARDTAL